MKISKIDKKSWYNEILVIIDKKFTYYKEKSIVLTNNSLYFSLLKSIDTYFDVWYVVNRIL